MHNRLLYGRPFGDVHPVTEAIYWVVWAAVIQCPDDRWDALDVQMRTSAMMALQPAAPWRMTARAS